MITGPNLKGHLQGLIPYSFSNWPFDWFGLFRPWSADFFAVLRVRIKI